MKGPLLLAANHPNSFLDAIILDSLFRHPVYSLARGDAFVSPFVKRLLHSFKMLPVYRITEGIENLENNYSTFNCVEKLLKQNQIVLVFSEGRCINEWHLRPLKKGTARMAIDAWSNNIDVKVLPVGINYSNFRYFGKKLVLNFGTLIHPESLIKEERGKSMVAFNQLLKEELSALVYEIPKDDIKKRREIFEIRTPVIQFILLALPAVIGFILHAPFFYAIHFIIRNRANDHYDSIMMGACFLFYPFYILLISFAALAITASWLSFLLFIIMPLTAQALLHIRDVVEK